MASSKGLNESNAFYGLLRKSNFAGAAFRPDRQVLVSPCAGAKHSLPTLRSNQPFLFTPHPGSKINGVMSSSPSLNVSVSSTPSTTPTSISAIKPKSTTSARSLQHGVDSPFYQQAFPLVSRLARFQECFSEGLGELAGIPLSNANGPIPKTLADLPLSPIVQEKGTKSGKKSAVLKQQVSSSKHAVERSSVHFKTTPGRIVYGRFLNRLHDGSLAIGIAGFVAHCPASHPVTALIRPDRRILQAFTVTKAEWKGRDMISIGVEPCTSVNPGVPNTKLRL